MVAKSRTYYIIAVGLAAAGILLFALDVATGKASAGIILIVPYIIGGGLYSLLGMLCIVGAFLVFYLGIARSGRLGYIADEFEDAREPSPAVDNEQKPSSAADDARQHSPAADNARLSQQAADTTQDSSAATGGARNPESQRAEGWPRKTADKSYGGVILIGPVPIIFGSGKRSMMMAIALSVIGLVIMLAAIIFFMHYWKP